MTRLSHTLLVYPSRDLILTILVIWLSNYSPIGISADIHPSTDRPQAAASSLTSTTALQSSVPPLTSDYSVDPSLVPAQETATIIIQTTPSNLTTNLPNTTPQHTADIVVSTPNTTAIETSSAPATNEASTTTATPPQPQQTFTLSTVIDSQPQPHCTLGDDTFQIGERWNPNLPPFGVQVCVLCECTIRQRKSCYEPKVTCRRIINECPVIDSCPDGKKPVTVAGQCCKSCQSTTSMGAGQQQQPQQQQEGNYQVQQQQQQQAQTINISNQSPAYESQQSVVAAAAATLNQTPLKIVYMNERTKDYLSMVKILPQCPSRDNNGESRATSSPTPSAKAPKGSRNDLNGIDTRLAFKSLHDTASNQLSSSWSSSKGRFEATNDKDSTSSSSRRVEQQHSDQDHHQHPNDVQFATSGSSSSSNNNNNQHSFNYGRSKQQGSDTTAGRTNTMASPSGTNCQLGNDTFQVGDVWNPILPPFGVQLCVQCNCIFRLRKGCYETKVTCRRVSRDCPVIDECPDGKPPVTVSGQCCKSCPSMLLNNIVLMDQQQLPGMTTTISPTMPLDGVQRNEKVYREFATVSRNLDVCVRTRESVDIYNTNRYARRSQKA